MSLLAWSEGRPDWQRDALRRVATSERLSAQETEAVWLRLRHANGIAVRDDTTCVPLSAQHLPKGEESGAPTVLCGIGPVRHVDRLAEDQELRFAVDGITLVFGDNGTGKSGYARIAKQLCLARVVDELQGDVFATQTSPLAQVRVRYRLPGPMELQTDDWIEGQERPPALARTMVLDAASAKVYIDGQNEITYLPREIEIAARFGGLCTALANKAQDEANAIEQRCRAVYGAGYHPETPAGRLVGSLTVPTALANLSSEEVLRAAAIWDQNKEAELAELTAALALNPVAQAAARRRIASILLALAENVEEIVSALDSRALEMVRVCKAEANAAAQAAALSAEQVFAREPIAKTGQGAWERMYAFARQFAAEAGIRPQDESFQPGDPCPTCQRGLDAPTAQRLRGFDEFVRGAASLADGAARAALEASVETIRVAPITPPKQAQRQLAEYASFGASEAGLTQSIFDWFALAILRRDAALAEIDAGRLDALGTLLPLSASPADALRIAAAGLEAEAAELDAKPAQDPRRLARQSELLDAKRLSQELDAVMTRRDELALRQRLLLCRADLDTRAVSQFASRRRRELVTPELREKIAAETAQLDLGHVPLRFEEASDHGRNFFDLTLDTRQEALKSRVLSEGEQRALGIACFFAEMSRLPGKHGIIVDDPVSSLDLQRLRKIAERLVEEAAAGRQVIVFTHHLVFYQEILSAAAGRAPQVPTLVSVIGKREGRFGIISEDDEPWIAKKVVRRIEAMRSRLRAIPENVDRDSEEYRRKAKDFYTDLRESWERLIEEALLNGVVERFCAGVKTQSLREVVVGDEDYQKIYAVMKRVSEFSGHDMATGRQLPMPGLTDMRRDLAEIDAYRSEIQGRKEALRERRRRLEEAPAGKVM